MDVATMSAEQLIVEVGLACEREQRMGTGGIRKAETVGSRRRIPVLLLQLLAVCMGGPVLAHLMDALCWDHRHYRSGLPDLLLWRILLPTGHGSDVADHLESNAAGSSAARRSNARARTSTSDLVNSTEAEIRQGWLRLVPGACYECRFVEVKGPRDVLADK